MDILKKLLDELDIKYKEKDKDIVVGNCLINFKASVGLKDEIKLTVFPWIQLVIIFILTVFCFFSSHETIKMLSVFFTIIISLNLIISYIFVFFVKMKLHECSKG